MLPFVAYHYHLEENLLSYADSEKDLGVHINKSFAFNEQCEILLTNTCINHQNRWKSNFLVQVWSFYHFQIKTYNFGQLRAN